MEQVKTLFEREHRALRMIVRGWPNPALLPEQAPAGLIAAYRDLAASIVARLVTAGHESAPAVAEHARQSLLANHPSLDAFSFQGRPARSIVLEAEGLTDGVAALINELLWATADHNGIGPEDLLRDLTWERRHLFASAGLYEKLSWKLT